MRWTEIKQNEWEQLAPYVDTLCLPIYSFDLTEKKWNRRQAEIIEQIAQRFEKRLMGRVLLLPAISYMGKDAEIFSSYLNEVIQELAGFSFHYLVMVADGKSNYIRKEQLPDCSPMQVLVHEITEAEEWNEEQMDQEIMDLYNKTINLWQTNT
ncbi:DUF2487 family protein [Thermoflavimicrobium dichotomicum]|nr:DUF2487 family protein [Thermoflavimicrobium dichotomicum]